MPLVSQKAESAFALGIQGIQQTAARDLRCTEPEERSRERLLCRTELPLGYQRRLFGSVVSGGRQGHNLGDWLVAITNQKLFTFPDACEERAELVLQLRDADRTTHMAIIAKLEPVRKGASDPAPCSRKRLAGVIAVP
jgi:hypothetical protein